MMSTSKCNGRVDGTAKEDHYDEVQPMVDKEQEVLSENVSTKHFYII